MYDDEALYLGNCKSRAPLLFQNVKTDTSIAVDVRVKYLCSKGNLAKHNILFKHYKLIDVFSAQDKRSTPMTNLWPQEKMMNGQLNESESKT